MDAQNLYPAAYVQFLIEFHATRDYFECHELLEEYWKDHPGDRYAEQWVGLIQLAVGAYHHRRNNTAGAVKMFRQSLTRLSADGQKLQELGLDSGRLLPLIAERMAAAEEQRPFADPDMPFADDSLVRRCQVECQSSGLVWGAPSSTDEALTNRHTLRDRSEVIAARQASAETKRQQRAQP
ncbi:DUF309 domain-containing protein [Paenibacillus oenotherae]|uniref:DUF309 domain-containing protein n=1 Tax=Paenibacillus oenotherae TaxID=1435645 RepID=A0ABS7D319_9BACL|nr:DUF309 domain-containing protein [Paenibacillus oenotherae]MBW7473967.1 DUF309 domain-containing protein [Paenibacillus oenotherae]